MSLVVMISTEYKIYSVSQNVLLFCFDVAKSNCLFFLAIVGPAFSLCPDDDPESQDKDHTFNMSLVNKFIEDTSIQSWGSSSKPKPTQHQQCLVRA